jgi:hypothetical protein
VSEQAKPRAEAAGYRPADFVARESDAVAELDS